MRGHIFGISWALIVIGFIGGAISLLVQWFTGGDVGGTMALLFGICIVAGIAISLITGLLVPIGIMLATIRKPRR